MVAKVNVHLRVTSINDSRHTVKGDLICTVYLCNNIILFNGLFNRHQRRLSVRLL